ncbi:hypothetical protein KVT40_001393 [Elsinoe batatas]|uniref:glutamate--tRNA ligase n=1 Tax=Elsinoe batatas TaxID=2601811 RepID=A0A8K0PLC2_9PEZI|nr:hypothetical protein KVT40_001393 [Elsinoe batatas]
MRRHVTKAVFVQAEIHVMFPTAPRTFQGPNHRCNSFIDSVIVVNMSRLIVATRGPTDQVFPILLATTFVNATRSQTAIEIEFASGDKVSGTSSCVHYQNEEAGSFDGCDAVLKELNTFASRVDDTTQEHVQEWFGRSASFRQTNFQALNKDLAELDSHLTLRSFIVGYRQTLADIVVYGIIRGNRFAAAAIGSYINVQRWTAFIEASSPWVLDQKNELNSQVNRAKVSQDDSSNMVALASRMAHGPVVTRFPPEPSGYLHIGHAKAALLNDILAHEGGGRLVCRFDDTNPSKESEEFQDSILVDLDAMGVKPDRITYSSDYFEQMFQACRKMIEQGHAYADDTEGPDMKHQRWHGIPSKNRELGGDVSLAKFDEMHTGSEEGQRWCIRAKISVDDANKALRDPVIYRCNLTPHHRTGATWKAYPTYDFCVPFVDALEGITLALRTTEYNDRNAQYRWIQQAMAVQTVPVWEFSRLSFVQTVLSKRKLAQIVEAGVVAGWDDPRMPTIRGILRRGMTVPALREFIRDQGPSRNVVTMDWTIFWATNKKYIDPVSPGHTVVRKDNAVTVTINGISETKSEMKPKHAKNAEVGMKKVVYGNKILIDQNDAKDLTPGEEITLMAWGNAIVTHVENTNGTAVGVTMDLHLEGNFKTTKKKISWLSTEQDLVPVVLHEFGPLITKDKLEKEDELFDYLNKSSEAKQDAVADCNVSALEAGDIIQFERYGYYRVDQPAADNEPAHCFKIPTGK